MTQRHGVRVNLLAGEPKIIYPAQRVKSAPAQTAPYVIEHDKDVKSKEQFVG